MRTPISSCCSYLKTAQAEIPGQGKILEYHPKSPSVIGFLSVLPENYNRDSGKTERFDPESAFKFESRSPVIYGFHLLLVVINSLLPAFRKVFENYSYFLLTAFFKLPTIQSHQLSELATELRKENSLCLNGYAVFVVMFSRESRLLRSAPYVRLPVRSLLSSPQRWAGPLNTLLA
ncbi:hypothetical protein GCWU000342_00854 [Shuttleworthella satelles DSM 14600]|uniref:Uncharacterized protein n=1 Tax=Shuttleworthella satelles DSM 14600 TaxID=626523 RepID=C4GA41_9FIRM|nr:hypothetical protein GCWU000342_00854 [Shuttleworthia satelles DSM 14600]